MTKWHVVLEMNDPEYDFMIVQWSHRSGNIAHYPKTGLSAVYSNVAEDHLWLPYNWVFE